MKGDISMEEKIVAILNEMSEFLSVPQMKKLQEVMLRTFSERGQERKQIDNDEYLKMFLEAKKIEGCSDRTIQYYRITLERMLESESTPVRKITTEDMRAYLANYQKKK